MAMNVSAQKRAAITPSMNVTPLVDVVLVLLIIFMVVTPLLTKQLWLNVPKKDDKAEKEPPPPNDADKPVVLTVDEAGVIRVNQKVMSKDELKGHLPRIFAARADGVLYFDAADNAPYGVTVEVMDLAKRSGARSLAILTEKTGN